MTEAEVKAVEIARHPKTDKRTKIVATLGPASKDIATIKKLIAAGADVFRCNFSHGTPESQAALIHNIREASSALGRHTAILADLQGPKFRTGDLENHQPVMLNTGETIRFVTGEVQKVGNAKVLTTGTEHAHVCIREVHVGHRILLNDGAVVLKVKERISREEIVCDVVFGGPVGDHKGINVPDLTLPIPALTDKDLRDALFALEQGVDFIALSFVQKASDIEQLRRLIAATKMRTPTHSLPLIIAKIEKPNAVDNIDSILEVSDGLMVARGDMGVECPIETVPSIQKLLIRKANAAGKFVITATQMLESMTTAPFPTRAEVSDVANAVYDGTDAVMLSGETAGGKFPVETVTMMSKIVHEADSTWRQLKGCELLPSPVHAPSNLGYAVCEAAAKAANGSSQFAAIVMICADHHYPLFLSKLRPVCPLLVMTYSATVASQAELVHGCTGELMEPPKPTDTTDSILIHMEHVLGKSILQDGESFVLCCPQDFPPSLSQSLSLRTFGKASKQAVIFSKWMTTVKETLKRNPRSALHLQQLPGAGAPAEPQKPLSGIIRERPPFGIVFVGSPGCGKTTQAKRLVALLKDERKVSLYHIAPGDIARRIDKEENKDDELAQEVRQAKAQGGLLMDSLNARLVCDEITSIPPESAGFILDSFPVTTRAAEQLNKQNAVYLNRIQLVVFFNVKTDVAVQRLSNEEPASLRTKLEFFQTELPKVVEWFAARGVTVVQVDANAAHDAVFNAVKAAVEPIVKNA